jgi:hypothetical protein
MAKGNVTLQENCQSPQKENNGKCEFAESRSAGGFCAGRGHLDLVP